MAEDTGGTSPIESVGAGEESQAGALGGEKPSAESTEATETERQLKGAREIQSRYDKLVSQLDEAGGVESLLEDRSLLTQILAHPQAEKLLMGTPEEKAEVGFVPESEEQKQALDFLEKWYAGKVKVTEAELLKKVAPVLTYLQNRESERTVATHYEQMAKDFPGWETLADEMAKRHEAGVKSGEFSKAMDFAPTYKHIRGLYLDVLADNPDKSEELAEKVVARKRERLTAKATSKPGAPVSAQGPGEINRFEDAFKYAKQKHGY